MAAKRKTQKPKVRTVTLGERDSMLAGRVEFATHVLEIFEGLVDDLENTVSFDDDEESAEKTDFVLEIFEGLVDDLENTVSFDDDEESAEKTDFALAISKRTVGNVCDMIRKLRAIDAQKIGKKPAATELPS